MADKRKQPAESLVSSDEELNEKNLRKRLRQQEEADDDEVTEVFPENAQKQAAVEVETPNQRPMRSARLGRASAAETNGSTRTRQKTTNAPKDYDTFLEENGIEERQPTKPTRRSARKKAEQDDWIVHDSESDTSEEPLPRTQKKRARSLGRAKNSKKQATKKPKGNAKRKAVKKGDSSSDSDGFEMPPPTQKSRGSRAAKKHQEYSSEDESSGDGAAAFKSKGKKKKKDSDEDSSDREDRVSVEEDSDDEGFIIDKILAHETHTKLEWEKKCHNMNTHYISRGSLFVDDAQESNTSSTDDTPNGEDGDPVEEPGIEKFLVKWRNLSYLHVTWETEAELIDYEKNAKGKIQRFFEREARGLMSDEMQGDEYFNPEFCTVDRILVVQESEVPREKGKGMQQEYYVKWKGLSYDECTWEQEVDVHDDAAVQLYHEFNKEPKRPPPAKRKGQFRPYHEKTNPIQFKNNMQLRDYQLTGVNWMIFNWYNNRNSLLADEMGLGKTVQTVTYINHLSTVENLRGPFLIIAPLSTLAHWQREFQAWTHLNAIIYHGSQNARKIIEKHEFYRDDANKSKGAKSYRFDVLITTFEMCTANDYLRLAKIDWDLAVVDEAHRLKNKKSKLSSVLEDRFKYKNLLLLTGTPLQNNVEELWTLLHFLDPEKFHSADEFVELFGDLKDSSQVEKLHNELKPFLLRRMKEDVEKSLAPKEETIIEVELTVFQKQYYRAIYERNSEFLSRGGKRAHAPSLMNIVMELRKCCNHPFLIKGAEEREAHRLQKELPKTLSSSEKRQTLQTQINELLVSSSGKLVLLDKLLPRLREGGHRVLIFSQFKIMLNILEDYLRIRGYPQERIDGSITGNDRQAAIDRFSDPQSNSFIMLLSTRAGGVGINLTAADTCIIYDSDWNPQNDLQAQARCHRIGQKKSVKVYRLLTSKTYELHMFHQASMKLGLDQAVLGGIRQVKSSTKGPSKEEIESLLKYGAYEMFKEDKDGESEAASKKFSEESVDEILSRSTTVVHDPKKQENNLFSSSFSKATFVSSTNPDEQVALDDPDFWIKVIGLTGVEESEDKVKTPEKRRCKGRMTYAEVGSDDERFRHYDKDGEYKFEDMSESTSDDEDMASEAKPSGAYSNVHKFHQNFVTALLSFGYGRWTKIRMADPILSEFSVVKIKDYAMGFLVQMIRVACMDNNKDSNPTAPNPSATNEAMSKLALKFKFVVYWLQVLHRENNPNSQSRELFDLHKIPVQEELTRLTVISSLTKSAGKYLQTLESLFLLDQFISKRLSPMPEVMSVLNLSNNREAISEPKVTPPAPPAELENEKTPDSQPSSETKPTNSEHNESTESQIAETKIEGKVTTEESGNEKASPEQPKLDSIVPAISNSANTETKNEDPKDSKPSPQGPFIDVKPEIVEKWQTFFKSLLVLPSIPVIGWWKCPDDDIRLLFGIHRHGWLKGGGKQQLQAIRKDEFLYPSSHPANPEDAPWPASSVITKRLKAIQRHWIDKVIQPHWPTSRQPATAKKSQPSQRVSSSAVKGPLPPTGPPPLPSIPSRPPPPPPTRPSSGVFSKAPMAPSTKVFIQDMWERRTRFIGLIMAHGIPDVLLCTSSMEEREKWRHFLFDNVLRVKNFATQELLAEAISLEQACKCFLNNTKPRMTNERSIFGGYRTDWVLSSEQARGILYRVELFRLLRREVLIMRPAELHDIMRKVIIHLRPMNPVPTWWRSPDCDILLMQGVECYGLDDNMKEVWLLGLFQKLNPTQNFPSVAWADGIVMSCAAAVVQARRAAEQIHQPPLHHQPHHHQPHPSPPHEALNAVSNDDDEMRQKEVFGMACEDPRYNKQAYLWYMLQQNEAQLKASANDPYQDIVRRDLQEKNMNGGHEEPRWTIQPPPKQTKPKNPEVIEILDDSDDE